MFAIDWFPSLLSIAVINTMTKGNPGRGLQVIQGSQDRNRSRDLEAGTEAETLGDSC